MATRQLNLHVDEKLYENLARMAKERGLMPGAYGRMLFEAAYSARCGKSGDEELEAIVAGAILLTAADFDTAKAAKALRCSEATVVRIQQAWRKTRGGG